MNSENKPKDKHQALLDQIVDSVNILVDNSKLNGAPVVIDQNPTHQNLFGRIEKEAQFGVLSTDFTMIHSGSLHKANNGFLVIPVEDLFKNIFSWDGLKRSLKDKKIIIEEGASKPKQ